MSRLSRLPASSFGVSLGTAGQASLWHMLNSKSPNRTGVLKAFTGAPAGINQAFWTLAVILLCSLVMLYLAKVVKHWSSAVREFRSSVNVNFFFMPFLAAMVLGDSAPAQWFSSNGGLPLLLITVLPLLALEVYLYAEWMYGVTRSLAWANPAYQLAMVGNIIGAHMASEAGLQFVAVFLLGVGVFYWIIMIAALHTVRDEKAWLSRGPVSSARISHTSLPKLKSHRRVTYEVSSEAVCTDDEDVLLLNNPETAGQTSDDDSALSPGLLSSEAGSVNQEVGKHRLQHPDQSPVASSSSSSPEISTQSGVMGLSAVETVHLNTWSSNSPSWSLPPALQPTLFLYVAPPSLVATTLLSMQGSCTQLCQASASIGFFMCLINLAHLPRYIRRTPFSFAVWSFTFPSSALAAAIVVFSDSYSSSFLSSLAACLIIVSLFFYLSAAAATILYISRRGLEIVLLPRPKAMDSAMSSPQSTQ